MRLTSQFLLAVMLTQLVAATAAGQDAPPEPGITLTTVTAQALPAPGAYAIKGSGIIRTPPGDWVIKETYMIVSGNGRFVQSPLSFPAVIPAPWTSTNAMWPKGSYNVQAFLVVEHKTTKERRGYATQVVPYKID